MNCIRRSVLLTLITFGLVGAQPAIRSIQIESHWRGYGTPRDSVLQIRRAKNGTYLLDGKLVDARLVNALVVALNEPAVAKYELENLGMTPDWLAANVAGALKRHNYGWAANQNEFYSKSLQDASLIAQLLPGMLNAVWSDDYPYVTVRVTRDDGTVSSAESRAQHPFMLPWKLANGRDSFNANISRALAALMPEGTSDRDRIAGKALDVELADAVKSHVERQIKLMDVENQAGATLARLRESYSVAAAEIDGSHSAEFGKEWSDSKPREINLQALLRRPGFPQNVYTALVLRQSSDGVIEGVDQFLRGAKKYEDMALSVGWLRDYLRDRADVRMRVSYVHNASLGEKAMATFDADMRAKGRNDLVLLVKPIQSKITLLLIGAQYGESYWLLLPDKRMMLWRYSGPSGLLRWTTKDFPPGRCAGLGPSNGGCVGAMITAEGQFVPERIHADQTCVASSPVRSTAKDEPLFPVHANGKGGFIDRTGKIVIPLCFETVEEFADGLARFERDGRWGYIDRRGTVVIEPRFSWAGEFSESLARVQLDGEALQIGARSGFINKRGEVAIPAVSDQLSGVANADQGFRNGLAIIQERGKSGFVDKTGRVVIRPRFDYVHHFTEGLAAVADGDRWGYINSAGDWVIRPQFDYASIFSEGMAPVSRGLDCGYIDRTGRFVLRPPMPSVEKDCAVVSGGFDQGFSRWKFGRKYGYIDSTGKIVIEPRFDLTFEFSEGLAAVMTAGSWGFIDTTGRHIFQLGALNRAESFHNGLAYIVTTDGKHGYVDRAGRYVWKPARRGSE